MVYTHLVAVVLCGLPSQLDMHHGAYEIPQWLESILYFSGACAAVTFLLYPVFVVGVLLLRWVRGMDAVLLVLLEILILFAQLIAFLPAVL